ncbi:MAG TPA: class I SAM-dependent rRNA methyltransferase [Bdellovibrionota bacterium]|nr:class I SAM-dependent rRNA methyltransferase [Bdellovibrionota bacterium]
MPSIAKVVLHPRKAGAAIGGHPWVYANTIQDVDGRPNDGDEVAVHAHEGDRFIGYGLFNSKSDIRIRLYSWTKDATLTNDLFRRRIEDAVYYRGKLLGLSDAKSAVRLVFSEADMLSGLTVDRYGSVLVVQMTSLALSKRLDLLVKALTEICRPTGICLRSVSEISKKEGLDLPDQVLAGEIPDEPIVIRDRDLLFEVSLRQGQKTGFYLDQRENRYVVADLAKGREVLDLYCYTGGFALWCAHKLAASVTAVDSSGPAILQAKWNAERNQISSVEFIEADAVDFLKSRAASSYSMVILDPPRLAFSQSTKERALRMYHRINIEALRVLKSGGILVSCSCSGRVTPSEWISLLAGAARRSGRFLQVIEERGAARDHPVSPHCPETHYLKCVIARIY